jgi:SAM-dependent methyltransferase
VGEVEPGPPQAQDHATHWPPYVCPEDGRELNVEPGALMCSVGHSFAVIGDIPRFVAGSTYADSFGVQWNYYGLTQLDSHSRASISRDRLRRCLGEELWSSLPCREVLECGCGAGRFTEILLDQGGLVTSVDLSRAVEANATNFPPDGRHRVAQADLLALPFRPRSFDVVVCLGVIQHTPSSEETIEALHEQVRPGGWLVLDHYSAGPVRRLGLASLLRPVFRRLPPGRALRACEALVDATLPLHRRAGRFAPLARRLTGVTSYYDRLPQLPDSAQREWAVLDTHDALTDWYKHARSSEQIRAILTRLGLEEIWVAEDGNGVEARGRRPRDHVRG